MSKDKITLELTTDECALIFSGLLAISDKLPADLSKTCHNLASNLLKL